MKSKLTIDEYGTKEWKLPSGKLHREDGPAIEYSNGNKEWWLSGQLHREDGPAIEYSNGNKQWWLNGQLHRESGPACEYNNGDKYWYLNGINYTEKKYKLEMRSKKLTKLLKQNSLIYGI
jgi:hypothetical protein